VEIADRILRKEEVPHRITLSTIKITPENVAEHLR
jgi:hypothetical protein